MTVLITGATGFIGRRLVNRLVESNMEVVALVRPGSTVMATKMLGERVAILEDPGTVTGLNELLDADPMGTVIHLATLFQRSHTPTDIEQLVESNISFGLRVVDAVATVSPGARFVNVGTIWQHLNSAPFDPISLYAATKQAFEDLLTYYAAIGALDVQTVVLPDTYGPDDPRTKVTSLLIDALVSGEPLDATSGHGVLDLLHIDDVVEGLFHALDPKLESGRWALSSGIGITVRDLAALLADLAGRPVPVRWGVLPNRRRQITELIRAAPLLPNWQPRVALNDGLQELLADAGVLYPWPG